MTVSGSTRTRLRLLPIIMSIGAVVGGVLNYFTVGPAHGTVLQGVIDGVAVTLLFGVYNLFLLRGPLRWVERFRFTVRVLINVSSYMVLLQLGRVLGNLLTNTESVRLSFGEFFLNSQLLIVIPVALALSVAFEFILQMKQMVGTNALRHFLMGTHRPKEEERLCMFLDLEASTRLAETLGRTRYYTLLRRFVDDLTEPILESRGEIYQYAGDEVIITWKEDRGPENANCLPCFFLVEDAIARNSASCERDYGAVPQFRAGLHGGTVIAGELGDIKQEIVFVGDILNTAARLERYSKQHDLRLVVSGSRIDVLNVPAHLSAERLTDFQPRGKTEIAVYNVTRAPGEPSSETSPRGEP